MSKVPQTPRRRWYQFSLRTLLVGMLSLCLLVGGVTAWVTYRRQRAQVNRERVEAVERAIAWVDEMGGLHDATTKRLRGQTWLEKVFDDPGTVEDPTEVIVVSEVDLSSAPIRDADMERIKALTSLQNIDLIATPLTDVGLKHLKRLTNLRVLFLEETQVTDAGLAHLAGLTNLTWLSPLGLANQRRWPGTRERTDPSPNP